MNWSRHCRSLLPCLSLSSAVQTPAARPAATRRGVLGLALATLASAATLGVATPSAQASTTHPPIVFMHGNGDSAAQWQTMLWRFETNGWPKERLFALRQPYPLARDNDSVEQAGRTSTAEHMAFLRDAVEHARKATGADKVVLVGNSRGGNAIRNYILNGGGQDTVSHAILGGTPNHGVWAIEGFMNENEFSGLSPFLQQLNTPKNAAGDEVVGPVQWMTLRSDNNDRYAQPDGRWLGRAGQPTMVDYDSPALKGANNVVLPGADHREVSYSEAAFAHTYRFITGKEPRTTAIEPHDNVQISGTITGLGLDPRVHDSGHFFNNLPLSGAKIEVYRTHPDTGERQGDVLLSQRVGSDGRWGPAPVPTHAPVELVVSAPGYATVHFYRSGFARSSAIIDVRAQRIPVAETYAPSLVYLWRPRGYLDPSRYMSLDGSMPPNVPAGAGVAISKVNPSGDVRAITGEFEQERITGRTWPAKSGHMVYLEITH